MSEQKKLDVVISYKQLGQGNVKSMNSTLASSDKFASNLQSILQKIGLIRFSNIVGLVKDVSNIGTSIKNATAGLNASKKALADWGTFSNKVLTSSNKSKDKIYRSSLNNILGRAGLTNEDKEGITNSLKGLEKIGPKGGVYYGTKELEEAMPKLLSASSERYEKELKTAQQLKEEAKTAAIVGGIVLAITAAIKLITSMFNLAEKTDDMAKASQKALMSTESYQKWAYAFDKAGISTEKLKESMKQLVQHEKNLSKYGIEGDNWEDKYSNAVKYIQSLGSASDKVAVATKLFGESATELMPLLNESSEDLVKEFRRIQELNGIASDYLSNMSEEFQNSVTDLKTAWQGLSNTVGEVLLPVLLDIVNGLTETIASISRWLKALLAPLVANFKALGYGAKVTKENTETTENLTRKLASFDNLNVLGENNQSVIDGDASDALGGATEEREVPEWLVKLGEIISTITSAISRVFELLKPLWDWLKEVGKDVWTFISDLWLSIKDIIGSLLIMLEPVFNYLDTRITFVMDGVRIAINLIMNIISGFVKYFSGILQIISGFMEGNWDKVKEGIKNMLRGICQMIGGVLEAVVNSVLVVLKAILNMCLNVFNSISKIFWNGIVGGIAKAYNWMAEKLGWKTWEVKDYSDTGAGKWVESSKASLENWGKADLSALWKWADGAVLTTPTIGLAGEYAGARSNPEIVTPQNVMYETVQAANGDMVSAFIQVGRQIVAAIENNGTEVTLDGATIARSVAKANNNYKLQTGGSLL